MDLDEHGIRHKLLPNGVLQETSHSDMADRVSTVSIPFGCFSY